MNFCPRCGVRMGSAFDGGREREACSGCGFIAYRNPVPVVIVMAERDGRLLAVLRKKAPLARYWAPVAGYVEIDESLEGACAREAKEETGFNIEVGRVLGVYSRADAGVVFVGYSARVSGGEAQPGEDEEEVAFFEPEELLNQPPPRVGTEAESLFFEALRNLIWQQSQTVGRRCGRD